MVKFIIATLVLILILLIVWWIKNKNENFSPYITTALPFIRRSDAAFDPLGDMAKAVEIKHLNKDYKSRENYLFDQLNVLVI